MSNKDKKILGRHRLTMLSLGHDSFVRADRVVGIAESGSLPMKRLRERALEENKLVDTTAGRKTKAIVVTDTDHVFLSALSPQTLVERLGGTASFMSKAQIEFEEGEFVS